MKQFSGITSTEVYYQCTHAYGAIPPATTGGSAETQPIEGAFPASIVAAAFILAGANAFCRIGVILEGARRHLVIGIACCFVLQKRRFGWA